jgi:hypothetical protein
MDFKKAAFIILISVSFVSLNIYSQDRVVGSLSNKPDRISVVYRELITDDNGIVNKSNEQLMSLNKLVSDSIMLWAKKFDLTKTTGFNSFGTYLGKKLNIPVNKKIDLLFIDNNGNEETYILWSKNNQKFEFEKTQTFKR